MCADLAYRILGFLDLGSKTPVSKEVFEKLVMEFSTY
jgi:hypothetical protein